MEGNPSKLEVSLDVKSNRVDIFDCKTASLTADGKKVVFATRFEQNSGEELDEPGVKFVSSIWAYLPAKNFAHGSPRRSR